MFGLGLESDAAITLIVFILGVVGSLFCWIFQRWWAMWRESVKARQKEAIKAIVDEALKEQNKKILELEGKYSAVKDDMHNSALSVVNMNAHFQNELNKLFYQGGSNTNV